MRITPEVCYRAVQAKDTRFDGVFFVGVKSTGIYCRPVCPARTPARKSCEFFDHAVEAEKAGFRACFRCRPELAPGQSSVDASSRITQSAVTLIHEGFLNHHSVDELAEKLDVTSRHLRRTLNNELGVSPQQLAQSKRLALAKQLVQETSLNLADVAFASGFASVRRFNDAFQKVLGCSPTKLRRSHQRTSEAKDTITLRLDYRPPLAWNFLLEFMQNRLMTGIENIDGSCYRRVVIWEDKVGWMSVTQDPKRNSLKLQLPLSLMEGVMPILSKVRSMFDLDAHPDKIIPHLSHDSHLQPLLESNPGLRIPGGFEKFPLLIRIILGQRIAVKSATTLCGRLIDSFGQKVTTPFDELTTDFPKPEVIAHCKPQELIELGIQPSRASTLQTLSSRIVSGEIVLDDSMERELLRERLLSIKGIGPWTVETMMMRAFGEPDAFPSSDLGLCKALNCTPKEAQTRSESWRPWRSYAATYLWSQGV